MKSKCIKILRKLTGKKHVYFTRRGNDSIKASLKLAKPRKNAYIQDQGGWITYEQFIRELHFNIGHLNTEYGLVSLRDVKSLADSDSVFLLNSMPGYFRLQKDIAEIYDLCKGQGAFLINDASGSIGTKYAMAGDIVIGSFGRWKPLDVEYGGFIASDTKLDVKEDTKDFFKELLTKLVELAQRQKKLTAIKRQVLSDLKEHDIIPGDGLNVIVRFSSPEESMRVLDYCKLKGFEFTMCPRYIRVNEDAVSIELKRL